MKDVNVEAMNSAVDMATREADTKLAQMESEVAAIREESRALGVLQKIKYDQAHNELLKYATLFQVRENKEYKQGGMTWEEFCNEIGEPKKTVNTKLKDIRPLVDNFQASLARFSKVPFNKIRYLGRSLRAESAQTDENSISIDGVTISLEADNKDEISAAIDTLIETHKKEQKDLKNKLQKARKNTDKIVEEETKGLTAERDALVKEVARLKPLDIEDRDITWCETYLKDLTGLCIDFEKGIRKMVMDNRIHEDMHVQAKCESMINLMARATRDLQREWDQEFNSDDEV